MICKEAKEALKEREEFLKEIRKEIYIFEEKICPHCGSEKARRSGWTGKYSCNECGYTLMHDLDKTITTKCNKGDCEICAKRHKHD